MIGDFHREDSWFQADSTGNALDWPVRGCGCFVVEIAVVSFGAADVKIVAAKTAAAAVLAVVGVPAGPDKVVEGSQTSHT